MPSFCGVTFVLLCFVFVFIVFFVEVALRSIVLRYAGAPIATRVFCLFFCFLLFIWRCRFFRVFSVPLPFSLGDFTQEADLVYGICGVHGGDETAEVRDVRIIDGRRGLCEGPGKRVDVMFTGRPQSFRHQRRPVDDCSPGRGGMAQNGGTRGGTFHGEMDRCRKSQGWTTACSRMPERDGKDPGEDSPKQTGSCWFARPC